MGAPRSVREFSRRRDVPPAEPAYGCAGSRMSVRSSLLLFALFSLFGCAAGNDRECTVGADCPSGACTASGMCVKPGTPTDARVDSADDAATDSESDASEDAPVTGCVPDKDGTITATEVPLGPGLKATFRVATNVTFATAGTARSDGSRKWDLAGALSGDKDVLVTTSSPTGTWWASKFAGASYATGLSASSDLLGVFQTTATAVLLRGVVSSTESLTKTELTYATPIAVLQFPLSSTSAWKTTSNVTGTASGVFSAYSESYDSKVDAHGELVTPFGTFDVLRVKTVLTRTLGVSVTVTRTFAFVTECFGTVASVTSQPNELSDEFTNAAEVRRIAP